MNRIMSVINGQTAASKRAVIEERYLAISTELAEIQPATALFDEALWHTLKSYGEVGTKYA